MISSELITSVHRTRKALIYIRQSTPHQVLTNGGPGYVTETVYTTVFKEFSKGRYGVSTALSTMLFIIMIVLGYFVIRLMSKADES